MLPETERYLAGAERNRQFARDVANTFAGHPPSLEWAAVIAFYAAIHYVNAYVWERLQYEPTSHAERVRMLVMFQELKPMLDRYRRLQDYGSRARYIPLFTLPLGRLLLLIDTDLASIEQHPNDLKVAVLRDQRQRDVLPLGVRCRQQASRLGGAAQAGHRGKVV